ncbi:Formylmethionine deformylase, partial [mine drainage metagenome]
MIHVATYPIRTFGDPVLRQVTSDIDNIDESVLRLVEDMIETMHEAPGVGLAATQVGVQKRLF